MDKKLEEYSLAPAETALVERELEASRAAQYRAQGAINALLAAHGLEGNWVYGAGKLVKEQPV